MKKEKSCCRTKHLFATNTLQINSQAASHNTITALHTSPCQSSAIVLCTASLQVTGRQSFIFIIIIIITSTYFVLWNAEQHPRISSFPTLSLYNPTHHLR